MSVVDIENLDVRIADVVHPVRGVSLHIEPGQVIGLVGESGCGKTLTSMAIAGLLPETATVSAERFRVGDNDMLNADQKAWQDLRRKTVGVIFQNPMKALNPRLLISSQLAEAMLPEDRVSLTRTYAKSMELLERVGVNRPAERLRQYPHELSGGLAQRVVIAIALARSPSLLIADEPTTALDASVQKQILDLIDRLRSELGLAVLLVSHDLEVIRERADEVAVMYAGRIVEYGRTAQIIERSSHPYTAALVAAMPSLSRGADHVLYGLEGLPPPLIDLPAGCALMPRCNLASDICARIDPALEKLPGIEHWAACHNNRGKPVQPARSESDTFQPSRECVTTIDHRPIMEIRSVNKTFGGRNLFGLNREHLAVDDVSLSIGARESLGIVGESGSGKTTVARMMVGLDTPSSGEILFGGKPVRNLEPSEFNRWRRDVQFVFQDSSSSLNPRYSIERSIEESLLMIEPNPTSRRERVQQLLTEVGLPESVAGRRPDQLSGGQRQRVGIARALARSPRLMIADEPVSALDVSVQATILNLLNRLRGERGMSYVIISHDLGVISYVCDKVAVMYGGRIVEFGDVDDVLGNPSQDYTRRLIDAAPGASQLGHASPRIPVASIPTD